MRALLRIGRPLYRLETGTTLYIKNQKNYTYKVTAITNQHLIDVIRYDNDGNYLERYKSQTPSYFSFERDGVPLSEIEGLF